MKIKAFIPYLTVILMLSTIDASASSMLGAASGPGGNEKTIKERVASMTPDQKQARAMEIKQQIEEIKKMDKSQLSSDQRKALRHELKDMKKELRAMGPTYIYISAGGLIIIILILILIL